MGAAFSGTATYKPPRGAEEPGAGPTSPAVDFDEIQRAILDLGLIESASLEKIAGAASGDVTRLVQALVRGGKLTAYQASALAQGKAKGLVIGDFLVLDKLGQGGMGVVFKARHRQNGRVVALKILPPSFGRDREVVLRFRREFEVAAKLSHPNVVSALEADEDRGVQFLTMEFIDGYDLDELVSDVGPLPIKLAIQCVIQAAKGLEAAHAQGIVHRDVKPANLMLDGSGNVRVLDLGLARVMEASNPLGKSVGQTLTQSGAYMGTVDYVAPEQADDSKKADARSDIYSLGCTLYFLLTGRPPFPGDTVLKKLMAHQQQPAPSLHSARNDVPAATEGAYQTMMAKKPGERPRSMTEVIDLLEGCRASADDSHEAKAGLKRAFAETVMKRASPKRRRGLDATIFARSGDSKGFQFDPDLNLEDLVGDYRDELGHGAIPEDKLPPIASRPQPRKPGRRRSNVSYGYGLAALALIAIAIAGYGMMPGTESEKTTSSVPLPTPTALEQEVGAFESIDGRPTLVAPYREVSPVVDGVIQPREYGPGVNVDFRAGSRYGAMFPGLKDPSLSKSHDDLSVRLFAAYTDRTLFLAFLVRDQFVDASESDRFLPYLNDSVAVFLDGDRVGNDFTPRAAPGTNGSKEGFQLCVDAAGNRFTVADGLNRGDWDAAAKRTSDGYVVEFEIPLTSIDVQDGPGTVAPTPGSLIDFGLALTDNDEDVSDQRSFAFLRARPDGESPFFAGETSWNFGIQLAAGPLPVAQVAGRRRDRDPASSQLAAGSTPVAQQAPRVLYVDEFNDPNSGWTSDSATTHPYGYARGVYFMQAEREGWWIHQLADSRPLVNDGATVQIVGRILGNQSVNPYPCRWHVLCETLDKSQWKDGAPRGFNIDISSKGELFLRPLFYSNRPQYAKEDPVIGPITHSAIKSGDQFNALELRLHKRQVEIFVNSIQVCPPVNFDWDVVPAWLKMGVNGSDGKSRAEIERIEVREIPPAPETSVGDNSSQNRTTPATPTTAVGDKPASRAPKVLFVDDYSTPLPYWSATTPDQLAENPSHRWGHREGIFFDEISAGEIAYGSHFLPDGPYPDFSCEIVARITGDKPTSKGSMQVHVVREGRGSWSKLTAPARSSSSRAGT